MSSLRDSEFQRLTQRLLAAEQRAEEERRARQQAGQDKQQAEQAQQQAEQARRRSRSPLSPDINTALPLLLVHISFTSSRFPASVPLSAPGPCSASSTHLRARTATHTHHTCTHSQHAPVEPDLFTTISIPRGAGLHLSSHR